MNGWFTSTSPNWNPENRIWTIHLHDDWGFQPLIFQGWNQQKSWGSQSRSPSPVGMTQCCEVVKWVYELHLKPWDVFSWDQPCCLVGCSFTRIYNCGVKVDGKKRVTPIGVASHLLSQVIYTDAWSDICISFVRRNGHGSQAMNLLSAELRRWRCEDLATADFNSKTSQIIWSLIDSFFLCLDISVWFQQMIILFVNFVVEVGRTTEAYSWCEAWLCFAQCYGDSEGIKAKWSWG